MSKYFLRLLVVIILIAGITTAVYFILNQPDDKKKLYDQYISLTKTENYQNYNYLTKEWTNQSTGLPTSLVAGNPTLSKHYNLANTIKEQIEKNLLLINYANKVDETAQKSVLEKLDVFNQKAYEKDSVAYQARYLYNYYVTQNDVTNVAYLYNRLLVAMHEMEIAGTQVLNELIKYVANNVYNGVRPEDAKYVLMDSFALVASVATSYENQVADTDELNTHIGAYQKYITKFETLVNNGKQNGFNTLGDLTAYIESYNAVDRQVVAQMLKADNKATFILGQTDASVRQNLTTIYNFMEATL